MKFVQSSKSLQWAIAAIALVVAAPQVLAQDAGTRVAVVNSEKVFNESNLAKAMQTRLQNEFTKRQNDLRDSAQKIQTAAEKLDRDAAVMNEAERVRRQRRPVDLRGRLLDAERRRHVTEGVDLHVGAGRADLRRRHRAAEGALQHQAEALAAKGSDDITAYRKLLDEWKNSGRTPGKSDDALWARFKAAGDAIYAARQVVEAAENVEFSANLAVKLELLKEGAKIDPTKDLAVAKKQLQDLQSKWEKAGKVPKDKIREVEDKLRAIEGKVRQAEEDNWRKTDPAAQARANDVLSQLEDSIKKLEADLAAATASKDKKKIDDASSALAARKAWLEVVKASMQ